MTEPLSEAEREYLFTWATRRVDELPRTASLILRLLATPTGVPGPIVRRDAEDGGGSRQAAEDIVHRLRGLRRDVLITAAQIGDDGFIAAEMERRKIGGRYPHVRMNELEHMGWLARQYAEDGAPLLRMGPYGSGQQVFTVTAGGLAELATTANQ